MATDGHKSTVLVIDDDASYREALAVGLDHEGFSVHVANDGRSGLHSFARTRPDVVLLDLRLPDMLGSEVLREIRTDSDTPVLMLSAVAEELDIVLCFELGADDYVTKPFRLRELVARMNSAIRKHDRTRLMSDLPHDLPGPMRIGPLEIDFLARTVDLHEKRLDVSRKEFDLLAQLALSHGRVVTREDLMRDVWNSEPSGDRTLDTHVYRLRAKIETDPSRPRWIITVRGVGFLLNDGHRGLREARDADEAGYQPKRPLM